MVVGVVACGVTAEDEEAVEVEENGEKTEPSTLFAFSREASFPTSMLSREGFLRCFGGGWGRKSYGTKPAGERMMCIECGRRLRGRQGGSGNCHCSLFSAASEGVYAI